MPARKLKLQTLDEVIAEMRRLDAEGYTPAGDWDLARTARHLDVAMMMSVDGAKFKIPWIARLMVKLFFKKKIFAKRRLPDGIKAPPEIQPPAEPGAATEAIDAYAADVRRLLAHEGDYQTHPVFGLLSRQQHIDFHVIHACHHLGNLLPGGGGKENAS